MTDTNGLNRRDFLRGATLASVGLAMAAEELVLSEQTAGAQAAAPAAPVNCAVIGLGTQGKEILASLAKLGNAPVVAICDSYSSPAFTKRASDIAPSATVVAEYKKVLDMPNVQAVFVATPTHLHKQIVLDALAAGKHVYCEAPLALDLAEAKAIATAGAAAKTVFQPGLQYRGNDMHNHAFSFSGGMAKKLGGLGQWYKKGSWKRDVGAPERTEALNWRLKKATSLGLPGEIGIHSMDVARWYLGALPVSVTGSGATMFYTQDGMEVPDTVECILEFPNTIPGMPNVRYTYNASLASSFAGTYELFYGSDCSIMIRDQRAWMFKETDAPLLGWEVYARKEKVGDDLGIVLVANATKIMARGEEPGKVGADLSKTALYQAIEKFLSLTRGEKRDPKHVVNGALEGYQATVIAAKAHEAVMTGTKIAFTPDMFAL